jgi:hypothetical protein
MTTIVIAGGHILVDDKLYVSLDFEAYTENGMIGIRHINQKELNLIKGRVLPADISLNGVTYATANEFTYAFNAITAPALSYLLTGLRSDVADITSDVADTEVELKRISGHANTGMQQFQQIIDTVQVTKNFFGFTPVSADAVVSILTNTDGTSGLGYLGVGGAAYQNVYYPGRFASIKLTSGKVVIFFDEQ